MMRWYFNDKRASAFISSDLTAKLGPALADSLSQSSDVTKRADGELALLSRFLRQKGK